MSRNITVIVAKYGLLGGDKLYQVRARQTLPLLVRQAKAGQTIYCSDLAFELNFPNPRCFNYILGAIGNALIDLSKLTNKTIPPIQCIIINKSHQLPGEGIEGFINQKDFKKFPKAQQKIIIDSELSRIYTYNEWDWVLDELGLEPTTTELENDLENAKDFRGGGESAYHKNFKEWISKNPKALRLKSTLEEGRLEYRLPSGDSIDIFFTDQDLKIGIEVKSHISSEIDILRGLFQCVKYKKILEAEQIINNQTPNSHAILAVEGTFPSRYIFAKNLLAVEVIDNINKERLY